MKTKNGDLINIPDRSSLVTKSKHTPGSWDIGHYPDDNGEYIVTKKHTICTLDQGYYDSAISDEECRANARLIAAAPDMFDACLKVMGLIDKKIKNRPELLELYLILAEATAKAEGNTK